MLLLSPPEEEEPRGSNLDIYHGKMMNCLRKIKTTFNPRGRITDKELWTWMPPDERRLASLVKEYEESIVRMFDMDEIGTPGWDRLEEWIEKADQIHRQRMHYCRDLASVCGEEVGNNVHVKDLRMKYMKSPAHRMVMRTYGPHWQSNMPGILRSYSASCTSLSQLIPLEKCRELTEFRTAKILRSWERLKRNKDEGAIDEFVEVWSKLDHSARLSWLRSRPGIWDIPHQDIYTWATCNHKELKQFGSGLFLTSFLNIEDLSRPDFLAGLLEARAKVAPQLFREFDARSVPFGLYAEALPVLRCEGRMIFTNDVSNKHTYEVKVETSSGSNWSALDPCNGLLSLEAQLRIYDFCLSCTTDTINVTSRESDVEDVAQSGTSTLLDRCHDSKLQSPDKIDLGYIKILLRASLDEAHDDLWQLRTNEDFWLQRMRETRAEACSSNLLLSVFGRIDTFAALCDMVDDSLATFNTDSNGLIESRLSGRDEAYAVMSLEAAMLSAQNDMIAAAGHVRHPRGNNTTATLSRLLELVMQDSPLVRIMGLAHVLRVIDREMRSKSEAQYATALVHIINDLAVLTFSLNQVGNHYLFTPSNWYDHFQKLDELEGTWKSRSLPCSSLIKLSLDEIDSETLRKLDVLWTRETISLEDRHFQFWAIVDERVEEMSWHVELQYSSLLEMLRQSKPRKAFHEAESVPAPVALPDDGPTLTAKQKGKRRAYPVVELLGEPSRSDTPKIDDIDQRPVIFVPMGPRRTWAFWNDLLHPGPSSPKEFSWLDFMASMAAVGYAYETTTGSVYRFEYRHTVNKHAINFHRPHGNVLNARQARAQWRDRILRRVRLELVED